MTQIQRTVGTRYRVWIVRYDGLAPAEWHGVPAGATAVEPAEEGAMTVRQAARYVESFNRAALRMGCQYWSVALPVTVRYEGEPKRGDLVA